ncbi:MAG: translocation/assembly module TamB domain-containing protein [Gemmatimonadaceae bacterium]
MRRGARIALGTTLVLALLAGAVLLIVTRSDVGRTRVRQFAINSLRNSINGTVAVGRLEGNLLGNFSLADVRITDSAGRPFLSAERVSARVNATALFWRRVAVSELVLVKAVIHLTKTPDEDWNYARVFRGDGGAKDTTLGWGDWIVLRNVTLIDGTLIVQRPWSPDADVKGAERDAVIARALRGETRTRIDRAPYGPRETIDFRAINGRLSRVIVADPESRDIVLQIDSLALIAAPFHPPVFNVRHFAGEVRVGNDTVIAPKFVLNLPITRTSGSFTYLLSNGDMDGSLRLDTLALAELRALYLPLPDSGGGKLNLTLAVRDTGASEYVVKDAALQTGRARVGGDLGLLVGDSAISFRDSDLTFSDFSTALIERLAPGVDTKVAGDLTGRAAIAGEPDALTLDANVTFDPVRHPAFRVVARGGVGFGDDLTARRLRVRGERVPVSLLREFAADPKIAGFVNADATFSGSTSSQLGGSYQLVHNDAGVVSRVDGEGSIAPKAGMRMDMRMRFRPISLELAERFATKTDFRGDVTGTGRVRGTPRDLAVRLDLRLPDTAAVQVDGTYKTPNDGIPVYTATVTLGGVDVQRIVPAVPTTLLRGVTTLNGRGTRLATMDARLDANLQLFMIDSAEFRDVIVKASAREGQATLDTLSAAATFGSVNAAGTFGLVEGRQGTLRYHAAVSDLAGLTRWIATGDTGLVQARPLIGARIARMQQQRDSVRREVQARENPAAQLAAELQQRPDRAAAATPRAVTLPAIPRDSIGGSLDATGDAQGNVKRFNLSGVVQTPGLVWSGNLVGAGRVTARWTDVGTPNNSLSADGGVDSIRALGFAFDSTRFRGSYERGEGDVQIAIFPGDTAEYRLDAMYALRADAREITFREIKLRFDSTAWASTRPSAITWRGRGITIDSLELRNADGRGGARIFVNGELPDVDPGRIEVAVDSLHLAPWLTLAQSDMAVDGVATVRGVMQGTRASPQINATVTLTQARYSGTVFPEIETRLDYDARVLTLDGRIRRANNGELARVTGTVPIDLSLGDTVRARLLETPLALTIEGDSIPLSPIAEFTEEVTSIAGRAYGRVTVAGTWKKPQLQGSLGVDAQHIGIAATGITIENVVGRVRMTGDTLAIDSLGGFSQGTIRGSGTILLAELDHPVLNLRLEASRARILRDDRGSLVADANVRVSGPIDTMTVSGNVLVRHGVIYIPDPASMDLINTEDPAIFAIVDTATARTLNVAVPSAFMRNLRLNVDLGVRRGVFARSSAANVEVYGNLRLRIDPTTNGKFAVNGALFTDQGDYTFMGKRFTVTRGSVRFTGEPDPNPVLQVLAAHEVRQAGREPLEIRVVLGGTLKKPNVSLESDAQPTLSQSDLIAFLAFGQSSSALLQFAGTGLEGGGQGGSSLGGNVAALARRQLASIAVGALVEEAKSDLAGATRADVLNITPAELPADMSLGNLQTLLRGTEIEIGKYADRHTFVLGRVRPWLAIPGALVERRIGQRFTLRGTFETRVQPRPPSLSTGLEPKPVQVLGALLLMKLAW